jgi:PAS domain S-box-containing protein
MLGFEKEALINKPIQKFIFRDDIDSYYLLSRSAVEAPEGFKLELRFVQSDGSPLWVNLHASQQNDDELWIIFSDINDRKQLEQLLRQANDTLEEKIAERTEDLSTTVTRLQQEIIERKRAETALTESEYFFKESQRAASIGSYRCDFVRGMWDSSEVLDTIFGIDEEYNRSIQGWLDIIHPDDRPMMDQYLREEIISNRNPFSKEYRIVRKNDGVTRWVLGLGKVTSDDNNNVLLMIGTIQDITEQKLADEALRLTRFSIDRSSDGIFWMTPDARIVDVNEAACLSLGYSKKELLHLTVPDIDPLYNADVWKQFFINLLQHGSLTFETVHTTKDGIQFPVEIVANHIQFGSEERSCAFVRNITDRKKAEEDKLLFDQQLQQTQRLESLGVLAGGIAHDFNNILAIIMGYCSLTKMDYETAEKNIPEMEKAAERAAALCRQMLAYAGKAPFENTQVDMRKVVTEMTKMLQSTISQNVGIKSELSADVPCVTGDVSQIRQVVMNLIINAAEAIGDAQGEVRVSLSMKVLTTDGPEKDYHGKIVPHGRYAFLEVADTGCGMSDETYNRLFEPFYSTKFTGRGLGMSAVLGIIQKHNGVLQISSELGKGTTFKIFLPVQIKDCAGEESLQQISSTPWQGSGTILLVEDEEQVKLVAKAMLEALGFTVIEASNGLEALELYQKNATDINLVVTDMGMPVMDGYQLFSELKALSPNLPIIISSGFGDTVVEARIASEDIAGSISKPYSFDRLRQVLEKVVGG